MKYFSHRKLLCELLKSPKLNACILLVHKKNADASIFVYNHQYEYEAAINFIFCVDSFIEQ